MALAAAVSCTGELPERSPSPDNEAAGQAKEVCIRGLLNVEFTEEMARHIETSGEEALLAEMHEYGIDSLVRMFPDAGEFEARHREAGLHRWYKVSYDPAVPATKAAASFREIPGAVTVEIPRKKHAAASFPFNDPYAGEQWNLCNTAQLRGFVKDVDINVIPLWGITGGSKDVIVNVVDTGIDMDHEDLQGVCIPADSHGSRNFVYGQEGYRITKGSHGTHVAGTIAAISNNGKGISGIAGGLDGKGGVRILNSQIFYERDDGKEDGGDSEAAIVWGADHGALISQNSWGYDYESEQEAKAAGVPRAFKAAVDYFIKNAGCDANGEQTGLMKGGLVVFAAGNEGWAYAHPADYEPIMAVGAIGPDGRRATYSNYGSWVDICAPGGEFDRFTDPMAMILAPAGGEYYYMAGTSMACPHVSGVAALLISALGGPGFTNEDLRGILLDGANHSCGTSEMIGPLLDAYGSYLAYSGEETPPVIKSDYYGNYTIRGHEKLVVNYTATSRKSKVSITASCDGSAKYRIDGQRCEVSFNDASGKWTGTHTLTITATSESGKSTTQTISYTILENHAPYVLREVRDVVFKSAGESLEEKLASVFRDDDGGTLSYSCSCSDETAIGCSLDGSTLILNALGNGAATITLTATDPCGLSCSTSFRAGVFDGRNGPEIYPVPVEDWMNILVAGISDTDVTIYNSAGKRLYSSHNPGASVLDPVRVDMSGFAPGRYRVEVTYLNRAFRKNVTKK